MPCGVGAPLKFLSTLSLRRATMLALGQSKHQAKFLSTLSLRRATSFDFCIICLPSYFYPRSPCGERLQSLTYGRCVLHFYPRSPCGERLCWFEELDQFDGISIHALLAESDSCPLARPFHCHDFYPRSPCGERLSSWTFSTFTNRISIHALLAESDQVSAGAVAHGEGISIHALLAESDRPGPR